MYKGEHDKSPLYITIVISTFKNKKVKIVNLSTENYTNEVKMVLNIQLSTKNRNYYIKMVLKKGFSTKMNLVEH